MYRYRRRARNVRRRGRKAWGRKRNLRTSSHTFTEMVSAGGLVVNQGGIFSTRFSDLPQANNYASLYKQFCIKKLQAIIVPRFNSFDPNTLGGGGSLATSWVQPRLTYAINDTPALTVPATELDVLTDNGCKIRLLNSKPIKINMTPKPEQLSSDLGGHPVVTRQQKLLWFNTNNPQVGFDGVNVVHHGAQYFLSGNPSRTDYMFDLFYKVTIGVRDPA